MIMKVARQTTHIKMSMMRLKIIQKVRSRVLALKSRALYIGHNFKDERNIREF